MIFCCTTCCAAHTARLRTGQGANEDGEMMRVRKVKEQVTNSDVFFNNLRGCSLRMAPASLLHSAALVSEANSPILIVLSVGGKPLLCLVAARLHVLYGHPPWAVYGIRE